METTAKIVEHPCASWAQRRLMQRCQIGAPAARVVGELAGIQAASRSTDEIVQTALVRPSIK
jgi:hypothetical protein